MTRVVQLLSTASASKRFRACAWQFVRLFGILSRGLQQFRPEFSNLLERVGISLRILRSGSPASLFLVHVLTIFSYAQRSIDLANSHVVRQRA